MLKLSLTKSNISWILYDFSNSAFHLVIITILFPLYFKDVLFNDHNNLELIWGVIIATPVFLLGVIAPFLGTLADRYACKRKIFLLGIFLSSLPIIFISTIEFSIEIQTLLFMVAVLFFHTALFIYDSFLYSQSSSKKERTIFSGVSWSLGYLGGIFSLLAIYPIIGSDSSSITTEQFFQSFLVIISFFIIFSIPAMINLKDGKKKASVYVNSSASEVMDTIKTWRKNKNIFKLLGATYLINDGLITLVYFTSIFASKTLGLSNKEILTGFIIVQAVGIPMTAVISIIATKISIKKTLIWLLILWCITVVLFVYAETYMQYLFISALVGCLIGSTPSLLRTLLANLVTKQNVTKFFGFNALSSRISSVIGPLLFGVITFLTGNQKIALASILVFFILGGWLLMYVEED